MSPRGPRARRRGLASLLPPRRGLGAAGVALAAAVSVAAGGCGKRGDPLPPFRRNPEPVQRLELAQKGETYELAFVTPTRTVDGAQLPVLDVELLISSEVGLLDDVAEPIRLKAAPGERIVHSGPLPEPGMPLRFAVRTRADGKPSALSAESLLVAKPVPSPPADVSVRATPEGLSLTWTECVPTTADPPPQREEETAAGDGEPPADGEADDEEDSGSAATTPGAQPPSGSTEEGPPAQRPGSRRPGEPAGEEAGEEAGPAPRPDRPPPDSDADPARELDAGSPDASAAPPEEESPQEGDAAPAETADAAASDETAGDEEPAAAPPAPAPSPGVRLYRRTADGEYEEPLVAAALATEAYLDADVEHGQELCYRLRTLLRGEPVVEGAESAEVCATFLDLAPPAAPTGLSVLRLDDAVELAWSPLPDGAEVPAALHVLRAVDDGPMERVAELEGDATRWTDPAAPDDAVVEYALTATDAHGNESAPSERARLIPR